MQRGNPPYRQSEPGLEHICLLSGSIVHLQCDLLLLVTLCKAIQWGAEVSDIPVQRKQVGPKRQHLFFQMLHKMTLVAKGRADTYDSLVASMVDRISHTSSRKSATSRS